MNKTQLAALVARRTGMSRREARAVIDTVFDPDPTVGLIAHELAVGGKVAISGFGTFEARGRKERVARNPHTGQAFHVPAWRVPAFRAGKPLKETLRGE